MSEEIYNIQEAKTHLSRLVEEALGGSDIVVAKAGKPLVRLIPYKKALAPRVGGQLSGQITETPAWWEDDDDPLAESIDGPLSDVEGDRRSFRYDATTPAAILVSESDEPKS